MSGAQLAIDDGLAKPVIQLAVHRNSAAMVDRDRRKETGCNAWHPATPTPCYVSSARVVISYQLIVAIAIDHYAWLDVLEGRRKSRQVKEAYLC